MPQFIELEKNKIYGVPIPGGHLRIDVSTDPEYPGIDIEFISDHEDMDENPHTRPRVVIESIDDGNGEHTLRTLAWADGASEDYSDDVEFSNANP